ncbi:MAG: class I SAM-dependent methyltransferase [Acidimicrobiales bacterium]
MPEHDDFSEAAPAGTVPDGYYDSPREDVLRFVPVGARRILDVGCGRGAFMEALRRRDPSVEVAGIEPEPAAAADGRARGLDVTQGLYPQAAAGLGRFDCIVFNDVLEHMPDPWAALEVTHDHLEASGTIVASLPNLRNMDTLRELLVRGDFRYKPSGVLDQTHLRFFTMTSAARMFEDSGYSVEHCEGTIKVRSRRLLAYNSVVNLPFPRLRREAAFRQFVIVARPKGAR